MEFLKYVLETTGWGESRRSWDILFCEAENELVLLEFLLHSTHWFSCKISVLQSQRNNLSRTNRIFSQEQTLAYGRAVGTKAPNSGEGIQDKELGAKKGKEITLLWKYNMVQQLTHPNVYFSSSSPLKSQLLYRVMLSFYTALIQ